MNKKRIRAYRRREKKEKNSEKRKREEKNSKEQSRQRQTEAIKKQYRTEKETSRLTEALSFSVGGFRRRVWSFSSVRQCSDLHSFGPRDSSFIVWQTEARGQSGDR